MALSNQQLADKLTNVADGWQTFVDQIRDWLAGNPTGGPNGDGLYPVTNGLGVTYMIPCPTMLVSIIAKGDTGAGIVPGHGQPNDTIGNDRDLYLDLDTGDFYGPKANGSWGTGGPLLATGLQAIFADTAEARDLTFEARNTVLDALTDITARHENIQQRHADITTKHADVEADREEVATNRQDVEDRQADVVSRQGVITGIQSDIQTRHTDITTKHGEIETDRQEVATNRQDVQDRQADVVSRQGVISGIQSDIVDRQTDIASRHQNIQTRHADIITKHDAVEADRAEVAGNTALVAADKQTVAQDRAVVQQLKEAAEDAADRAEDAAGGNYVPLSQKGEPGGVATLDAGGKVPMSQLDTDLLGGLIYVGTWNAATNTPPIPAAASNNKGRYYKVSVAGSTNVSGITDWGVGDWVVSNGANWDKIDNSELVTSVAGRTGAVTLTKADVGLSNVTNTSDANKPVSTAQQNALNAKVNVSDKSDLPMARAGVDNGHWMTPATTKEAILTIAGGGLNQFSISVVATGAQQTVDLGQAVDLTELLIFENGVEQDATGITLSGTSVTFTREAGAKMRFMLAGGFKGRAFEGDARGTLAHRSTYDTAPVDFCYLATDTAEFYFKTSGGWGPAKPMRGPKGEDGIDGIDGVDAINPLDPWQKKTASFGAENRGRYYVVGSNITMSLPLAGDGKEVWVRGNFKANNMVVHREGAQIVNKDGVPVYEDVTLNANSICAKFVCFDGVWTVSQ